MTATASVIVVSHGRPQLLLRTLLGLHQQFHETFEVIVVSCSQGARAVQKSRFAADVKLATFDDENISAARNIGIGMAAGRAIAFIDDDAVPEPDWLGHLIAPIVNGEAEAAAGYVRGRNGISFQSRAVMVDRLGWDHPVDVASVGKRICGKQGDRFVKTVGTNCAFKAEALRKVGGFDPAYRFYMDETDLNARLADAGARVAIVPAAEVTHGFAPSSRRKSNRLPRSLFEEAASVAVFLRKYATPGELEEQRIARRAGQHERLVRHLVAGTAEPKDMRRLLATYDQGWEDGLARRLEVLSSLNTQPPAFRPFPTAQGDTAAFAGPRHASASLREKAGAHVMAGGRALLFLFGRNALYHRRSFGDDGVWVQQGGRFGRSDRTMPIFSRFTALGRAKHELARLRTQHWPKPATLFMESERWER